MQKDQDESRHVYDFLNIGDTNNRIAEEEERDFVCCQVKEFLLWPPAWEAAA